MKLTLSVNTVTWLCRLWALVGACLLVTHMNPDTWQWQVIGMVCVYFGATCVGFKKGLDKGMAIMEDFIDFMKPDAE